LLYQSSAPSRAREQTKREVLKQKIMEAGGALYIRKGFSRTINVKILETWVSASGAWEGRCVERGVRGVKISMSW
jgi:hypothetical protein